MGLTIHYDLSLPAEVPESEVCRLLTRLRNEALALPVKGVSQLVRLTEHDIDAPWPMAGLGFKRLEDVVDVVGRFMRDEFHRETLGLDIEQTPSNEYFRVEAPEGLRIVIVGFAIAPGSGSEPAAFGLAKLATAGAPGRWAWRTFCKTQYASAHGEKHFLKCHKSVIALLDVAHDLGMTLDVHDETAFYESRDESRLLAAVDAMNRLIAQFAGAFSDAYAGAGGDGRQVRGEIFQHPDFERLEMRD